MVLALMWTSCEKDDVPVVLPPEGDAEYGVVEMGEDYVTQVFFDFESGMPVYQSEINSWHLALEASAEGFHVFMNGGADVFVYNTHETDFTKVGKDQAPDDYSSDWMFDRPCGLNDSTAIGDWRGKNEVYIVKLNSTQISDNIKKIRLVNVSGTEYVLEYGNIDETSAHIIHIPKDPAYNYSYFTFNEEGKVIQPDPPKDTWDIVFTRYRFIYYDMDNFPYIVNGVLTNPYKTMAYAPDSTQTAEGIPVEEVPGLPFSTHRDIVGFGWKHYNFDKQRYEILKDKDYYIKNRNGSYWKLNFLDFYNKQNIKGSPSFEYKRLF